MQYLLLHLEILHVLFVEAILLQDFLGHDLVIHSLSWQAFELQLLAHVWIVELRLILLSSLISLLLAACSTLIVFLLEEAFFRYVEYLVAFVIQETAMTFEAVRVAQVPRFAQTSRIQTLRVHRGVSQAPLKALVDV